MLYRTLGRTGRSVSTLGLGGHTYDIGEGKFATLDERATLVKTLLDHGVNYFDTTWFHEVELLADSLRRLQVDPATLHLSLQHVDGMSDPDWPRKLRRELTSRLDLLGLKKAPLFLMGTGNGKPSRHTITAAIHAMNDLRAEGLIDHVGVSCHELADYAPLADAIEDTDGVDYLMLRYNFKYRQIEQRLIPLALQRNIGVVAMLIFCWDCGPGAWGRRISVFEGAKESTPAQENIRWILQRPAIATTVPAMNTLHEVHANLQAASDLSRPADTSSFQAFLNRLWSPAELQHLAAHAESQDIRTRAAALLVGDGSTQP